MKKTLIALAAVAATGAAMAQSSVTLYGVADAAIVKTTGQDAVLASSSGMNNGTSRWGVRGVEDLGGGMKAGFNFEAGLSLNDGSTGQSGGNYFSRAAYMNLMGGFGELRLGRTLNPSFYAAAAWELTGTANYSAAVGQFGSVLGGIRNSSQIAYTTPNFGGVSATLGYILKGNNGGNAKTDLNVIYKAGPLAAALGYNKVSGAADDNWHVGANYNFGGFKIAGSYVDPADTTAVDSKGFTIGASTMVGPVALTLDIARDTGFKDTDVLLEAKYPLSKRTFAYAAFLRNGKGKTVDNVNNVGLGIRHNF
jgi:predicted porin